MKFPIITFVLFGLSAIRAENVNVHCVFRVIANLYTCNLDEITLSTGGNFNIVIGGQHLEGRTNNDVEVVNVLNSNVPFIIKELFTTFPNIDDLRILNGSLTEIKAGDFAYANKLRILNTRNNPKLTFVGVNAFTGASNLQSLILQVNQIANLDEGVFNGLSNLVYLSVEDTLIYDIPANIFSSLTKLQYVSMSNNQLSSLDGKLFANNPEMFMMMFANNHIKSIGRQFLDNLNGLKGLNLQGNSCVNQFFSIDIIRTIKYIKEGLSQCFDNFDYALVGGRFNGRSFGKRF